MIRLELVIIAIDIPLSIVFYWPKTRQVRQRRTLELISSGSYDRIAFWPISCFNPDSLEMICFPSASLASEVDEGDIEKS